MADIKIKETENSTEVIVESYDIIDCKNYVELKEPKTMGFSNRSKNINDINDRFSHDVVDFYGPKNILLS